MGRFGALVRLWDRPSQLSFAIALILLLLALLTAAWGPGSLRQPALIGAFGLVIVAQLVVMWANRGMVTSYTRAQRLYLSGDFEAACNLLEKLRQQDKAGVRELTLLGNSYRQLGLLDQSESVLREALSLQPNFHFPLYGFGRTLLIQGRYAEAAQAVEDAFAQGAPPVVQLDAGEAYYRIGNNDRALALIEAGLVSTNEPYRLLMGQYLLYRMGQSDPPEKSLLAAGMDYWEAQVERYRDTGYAGELLEDIRAMQALKEEA